MEINVTKEDGVVVVAVAGEMDADTSTKLRDCVSGLLAGGEHKFLVDMTAVDFVDSSGLGTLVMLSKRVRIGQGDVRLCSIKPEILRIFELTRLDLVFEISPSRAEALRRFQ